MERATDTACTGLTSFLILILFAASGKVCFRLSETKGFHFALFSLFASAGLHIDE
jgi:hypothetical protein